MMTFHSKYCYVCGTTENIHTHHVFYGSSNRKNSEKYGMVVDLCGWHHNLSNAGVHFDKELDLMLKRKYQKMWEEKYGNREDFIKIFGKNYLWGDDL